MDILNIFKENKLVESVNNAQQAIKTTGKLISLISDNKVSASVREMLQGLKTIITEKPNITSVNHFINHFLLQISPENQPIIIKELLEVFHERWKNVDRKTAETAIQQYDFNGKNILIHGSDVTITALIENLVVNLKTCNVTQIVTVHDKIGKQQATEIAELGIPVSVIDDSEISKYIQQTDVVIMSAEIVMHETFIAKSGAYNLCIIANHFKVPVYILSDTRKILNKKYFPNSVVDTFVGKNKKPIVDVWKDAPDNINTNYLHLEEVSNHLITKFVFENDAYTPEELPEQVDKTLVAKFI
jgi:translation initiation factor 2B subunit (eIF-2B alpha/beta/delta family)